MLNKNTFKDFIDCAKYLLNNHYTVSSKLAIWGRSAGGLLIGSVINMAPELFNLAILGVPFLDLSDRCIIHANLLQRKNTMNGVILVLK